MYTSSKANQAVGVVLKLIITSFSKRAYSAEETVHVIVGWFMLQHNRDLVTINIKNYYWREVDFKKDDE